MAVTRYAGSGYLKTRAAVSAEEAALPIFASAGVEAALEHVPPGRGQGQLQHFAHGLGLAVSAVDKLEDAAERPLGIGAGEELHAIARPDVAAL